MRIVRISDYIEDIKPFYYISDDGKVYSNNKLLKQDIDRGYCRVTLATISGKFKHYFIHFLVNYIFNGKPNPLINDPVTDHINGIRNDNRYENLRWLSNQDNRSYAYRHNGNKSNIDDLALKDIFDMYNSGFTTVEISKKYNVSVGYTREILTFRARRDDIKRLSLKPIPINHSRYNRYRSDIDDLDLKNIFDMYNEDFTTGEIGKKYNVSGTYIYEILSFRARRDDSERLSLKPVSFKRGRHRSKHVSNERGLKPKLKPISNERGLKPKLKPVSNEYRHNRCRLDIDDLALKDIFDMYNEGFTTGEIGKKYNVSAGYIYEILSFRKRRYDSERLSLTPISVNHKPRIYSNLTKNDILDIFNLFNSGISCIDIADKYNISVAYTRDILRGRAKLKEIHELKLEPVKETHISSKIINKIIYDILYLNKTNDEIISKYNVTKSFINDIKYKHSCKENTKNIDFKQNSKMVLFDPQFEISNFEEFDILNDIYNRYDFLSQSEEIDLFSSNEIKIGDTEYLF